MWLSLIIFLMVFAGLRFAGFVLGITARRSEAAKKWQIRFPFFEFLIWIITSFWIVNRLFEQSAFFYPIIICLIIIILSLFSWFFLRDFFAGLIIRTDTSLQIGRFVESENFTGKLHRLDYLSLQILSENGKIIKIPYHRLSSQKITFLDPVGIFRAYIFRIKTGKHIAPSEVLGRLHKAALCSVWASACHEPLIRKTEETESESLYEITIYALSSAHAERTAENLKNQLN